MKISKSDSIYSHLKTRIFSGEFNAANRLPSEKELSAFYGCSRPTLRKALESLEQDALIIRKQGAGSFLTPQCTEAGINSLRSNAHVSLFGIIFPDLGANYVFNVIAGELARIVSRMNCSLSWGGTLSPLSPTLLDDVEQICRKYIELEVDGVFFAPLEYTPLRDEANSYIERTLRAAGIPIVLIDSDLVDFPHRSGLDLVSLDHAQASYQITHHLLNQGVKRLHFISPPMSTHTIKLRHIGFREALFDANIPLDESNIHEGAPDDLSFVQALLKREPGGIICSNDGTAITLLSSLKTLGVSVPKDLVVAGFDNLSYLSQIHTPLTSIAQPLETISIEAVRILLERIQQPEKPPKTVRFTGILIERKSTRYGVD